MAQVDTSVVSGGGGGFLGGLEQLIGLAGPLLDRFGVGQPRLAVQPQPVSLPAALAPTVARQVATAPRVTLPGGAVVSPVGGIEDALAIFSELGLPLIDIVGQGRGGELTEPFRRTASGSRAVPHVRVSPNGRQEWFRPAGHPVMFSKDLGICRKVETLAKRAARATRSRTRRRPR